EHLLTERGDAVPVHEKARAQTLVADARQALKEDAPADRLRSLTLELQQVYQSLSAAGAAPPPGGQSPQGGQSQPGGQPGGQQGGDDDVIDAEFTANE
ncbi:MAG TPA: molecular chaperone DnaK, partial [Streptosporangiaceae bacterium]